MAGKRSISVLHASALAFCLVGGACGGREVIETPGAGGSGTGGSGGSSHTGGNAGTALAGNGQASSDQQEPTCDERRRTYAVYRDQQLAKHNTTVCGACTLVFEDNNCVANCGTAIMGKNAPSYLEGLRAFAESTCGGCPAPQPIPCPAFAARCTATGLGCELYTPGFP